MSESAIHAPTLVLIVSQPVSECTACSLRPVISQDSKTLEAGVNWLEKDHVRGGFVFVAVTAAGHVVLIPGALFCLTSGAIFGLVLGATLAWLGTAIGQTLAFCTGRWVQAAAPTEALQVAFESAKTRGWICACSVLLALQLSIMSR